MCFYAHLMFKKYKLVFNFEMKEFVYIVFIFCNCRWDLLHNCESELNAVYVSYSNSF